MLGRVDRATSFGVPAAIVRTPGKYRQKNVNDGQERVPVNRNIPHPPKWTDHIFRS